jgi:transcriptional regulator with XRE-family HTH domain
MLATEAAVIIRRMPVNPTFLKERREALGLTQQQVADKAKMKQQAYARIEGGDRINPNFQTAEKIADALGVKLDELRVGRTKRRGG